MQYMGAIRDRKAAERHADAMAKDCKCLVVLEKAKCRNPGERSSHVCYRGWMNREAAGPRVIREYAKQAPRRRR